MKNAADPNDLTASERDRRAVTPPANTSFSYSQYRIGIPVLLYHHVQY